MKRLIILALVLTALTGFTQERPYTKMETYFKGTNYELSVYRIYGRKDGNTMLVIGGIQGDEPGGFLSADLYSDLHLEQGNLIVIPRANFKSVILYDRGPDGDMNRRFLDEPEAVEMDKVVSVVKRLMSESDVFLNLHDGWGYHNPVYIDSNRNPKKFGQSIITDADTYKCENGKVLDLNTPANKAMAEVNRKINDDRYSLHYFNTDTANPNTPFSDMRKTATYYALRKYCIPAYGIESSKNLPTNEMKVLHHNYAVNEFMKIYGIVPEVPAVIIEKPSLDFMMINVNGEPIKVKKNGTLKIKSGDVCEITHIESNYERGISADLIGYGTLNDMNSKFSVKRDGVIVVRKDSRKIGIINIDVDKQQTAAVAKPEPKQEPKQEPVAQADGYSILLIHNGVKKLVPENTVYDVKTDDKVELKALVSGTQELSYKINLKGYVAPNVVNNDGDDRNIEIDMNPKRFMTKYAEDDAKKMYPVVVGSTGSEIAKFWLRMK
ncbi:MAG: M14/M99 family metallopeptidase [Deferribacterales bacterium]